MSIRGFGSCLGFGPILFGTGAIATNLGLGLGSRPTYARDETHRGRGLNVRGFSSWYSGQRGLQAQFIRLCFREG